MAPCAANTLVPHVLSGRLPQPVRSTYNVTASASRWYSDSNSLLLFPFPLPLPLPLVLGGSMKLLHCPVLRHLSERQQRWQRACLQILQAWVASPEQFWQAAGAEAVADEDALLMFTPRASNWFSTHRNHLRFSWWLLPVAVRSVPTTLM